MHRSVRQWVEGVVDGSVISSAALPGGTATVVSVRCQTADGVRDLVAKVYALIHPFATRAVVAREAAAMRGAATAVPTPVVLAATWDSPHGAHVEGNGLLMERLTGRSRLEEPHVIADVAAMAAALAAIHDLSPPAAPTSWPGPPPKFPDQGTTPRWTGRAEEWGDAFHAMSEKRPGSAPVFLHGDFHPDNLLFDRDGVLTGVIDWSAASVGVPEYDVAEVRAHVALLAGVEAADRLLSTYTALTGRQLPNQAWFDLVAAVSLFCPEPSAKWEWRHPRLNATLLRPRLENYVLQRSREVLRG